jgi:hypothetical protein
MCLLDRFISGPFVTSFLSTKVIPPPTFKKSDTFLELIYFSLENSIVFMTFTSGISSNYGDGDPRPDLYFLATFLVFWLFKDTLEVDGLFLSESLSLESTLVNDLVKDTLLLYPVDFWSFFIKLALLFSFLIVERPFLLSAIDRFSVLLPLGDSFFSAILLKMSEGLSS